MKITAETLIGSVDVMPGKQPHISLGKFKKNRPPKGFSIHLTPDPEEDVIAAHVATLEQDDDTYEFILHVANYGSDMIHAEVWKM